MRVNLQNHPKLKHDQIVHGSKRFKATLNYKGGYQNLKNLGENSCSCNKWQLAGEPRFLDDYSLSDRLFNNKRTY